MNYNRLIFGIRNRGLGLQVLWTGSSAVLYGPIMDQRRRVARDKPELRRASDPGHGSLLRGVLEGEGSGLVLIEGGMGRWTTRGELATVGNRWAMIELDGGGQYGRGWSEPMRGMGRWCGDGALGCLL
jgi:hypothetical protein